MAGDLDFNVQLRVLNEQFNNGINQARDKFTQYAQSVQRNVEQMNTDTERATTMLAGLSNVSSDRLTAEIRATADQLRQMGAGANLSGEQVEAAMQASALQVTRLGRQLDVARQEAVRLSQTNASPEDILRATQEVDRLEQELGQARSASVSLANELSGAMNRASSTADNARNAIYRITNVRVPETIRGEIDQISRSLVDFQNNSGRPAAEIDRVTREAEEQIRRLERELNGLDDTQNNAANGANNLGNNVNKLKGAFGSLQGLLAAAGLGIGIAEIIETADAFKTLEARIKLATGEGVNFISGFEGVKEIANATFSSVENTGELFARISAAAESMGLAQTEVLSVTKTINEAIQLSGGSAASADAAITQLIQGLQSGVVRGEEFNSIMEQAPRLAKAMADGLGVTRGELRALAQDGKLTSEVVINAVREQGEAINTEFATLPTTVANSLQVAKNQIFNFIGEIDKTIGQSSKLSEAISYIGGSLEDLDPSMVSALTGAFQNTIGAVVELAKGIKDVYDTFGSLISIIAGGSADAAEQVGLITAALHGLNIFIGFIKDGFSAIGVAAGFVVASLYGAMSDLANIASSITFGDISDSFKQTADELQVKSKETWDSAEKDVLNWESSGAQAITNAAKTAKERFADIAAESEKTYNKMIEGGTASAEAIEGQLVKMVADRIKANDDVLDDQTRLLLAEKDLQATIDETGKVSIESAKATQASYTGVGESFAEVALKAQESGKSIELSLSEAIHKANTRGAVDDIVNSLQAMANQGVITGEQLALGQNIAKTQYEIVGQQIAKNMETFGEYAAGVLAKNGNIITAELQHTASLENLAIQMDETGNVMITELDRSTVASGRTKEQIDELAGAVGVGLSKEFIKSSEGLNELVDGFDDLEKAGYDAGAALVNSLTAMSDKASNTVEIEALIVKWNELYKEGKITGKELADGLDGVKNRADILKDGINGVTEAYGLLGLKTREELAKDAGAYTDAYNIVKKDGQATAQQLEESFEKTAKANIAANGGVIDAITRRMAAERGVTVAVDEQGRVTFEKMGQATKANDNVTTSVGRIKTAYDGIASSAGIAGQAMVRAASEASSAYDKLQAKIKGVKEAMELKNADETLKNLRVYGTEKAPSEGNQFGSKLAVENFLKSAGLSAERAAEEARKIYAKQGTSDGALNVAELQGFKEGQVMTAADLARFKTASVYLSEIASKARDDEARRSKYESKLQKPDDGGSSNNNQGNNQSSNNNSGPDMSQEAQRRRADLIYRDKMAELERKKSNGLSGQNLKDQELIVKAAADALRNLGGSVPQPVLPQSALDAIASLSKQPSYSAPSSGPVKTIKLDLSFNGNGVSTEMPADQEAMLMTLVKALQDSKALSGQ